MDGIAKLATIIRRTPPTYGRRWNDKGRRARGIFSKIILLFLKYFTFYCMQVECSACEIVFSARTFSLRSNTQRSATLSPSPTARRRTRPLPPRSGPGGGRRRRPDTARQSRDSATGTRATEAAMVPTAVTWVAAVALRPRSHRSGTFHV